MSLPFDDIATLLSDLPEADEAARARAEAGLSSAGLGRVGAAAAWLAGWREGPIRRPIMALYAASHAGAEEPAGATRARLDALAAGDGAAPAAARGLGAGVEAFDLAADRPCPDAALQAAMSERECAATLAFGMEALAKTPDLLIVGEIAAGAERAAGALAHALYGETADAWTTTAVARARGAGAETPLELLRELGGRETAAMAGAILAARVQKVPVLLDGYAAAAAGAVLEAMRPGALDHCLAADAGAGTPHARLLERLGKTPLLSLGLRGPGLAGLAALSLLRLATASGETRP